MNYLFMKNFWFFSDDDCVLLAGGRYYFNRRLEVFGRNTISYANLPRLPKRIAFNKLLLVNNKVKVFTIASFSI